MREELEDGVRDRTSSKFIAYKLLKQVKKIHLKNLDSFLCWELTSPSAWEMAEETDEWNILTTDDGDSSPNALKAHREHTEFGSRFPSFPEWVRRLYCMSALEQGSLWLWSVFIKQNHTVFQRSGFPKTHSHSGQQPHPSLLRCKHATLWVLPTQEFGVQGSIFSSGNIMLVTYPLLCTYYIQHTHRVCSKTATNHNDVVRTF